MLNFRRVFHRSHVCAFHLLERLSVIWVFGVFVRVCWDDTGVKLKLFQKTKKKLVFLTIATGVIDNNNKL